MSDTTLWVLFVVNSLAMVGLLAVAVRGVRRATAAEWPDEPVASADEPFEVLDEDGAREVVAAPSVIDLTEPSVEEKGVPALVVPSPRAALDEARWSQG
jgi:hypothetical protein